MEILKNSLPHDRYELLNIHRVCELINKPNVLRASFENAKGFLKIKVPLYDGNLVNSYS